ncbi:MAG: TRAP transporter substrate-binding protein DctP [Beijerinckiaceae bacterium]
MRNLHRLVLVSAAAAAFLAGGQSLSAAEMELKAAGPWPKTYPLMQSFFRFIDKANAAGKGHYNIRYVGGPEITNPRQQPTAMKNGLIDMIYGPPAYYLGLFPEGDFSHGFKTAMEQRAAGAYELVREAMKQKMAARFVARFDSGVGLHLFLSEKPKFVDGKPGILDLKGLKLRSSPTYRDFIKDMGGTAVVMGPADAYTAFERGALEGAGFSVTDILPRGLQKFVKYMIDPPFSYATIALVMNQKKWDSMSPEAKKIFDKAAADWEKESYEYWVAEENKEKEKLKKAGVTIVKLDGEAAKNYKALFLKGPWERMEKNPKIKIDMKKLKQLSY